MDKSQYTEVFQTIKKNTIILQYNQDMTNSDFNKNNLGKSKFGGYPHLPSDFEWYFYEGTSYDKVTANRPLAFLAQINLEELTNFDEDHLLPSRGMLYFFYEMDTMTWGFDPKDKGSARVYYYSGDMEQLALVNPPKELSSYYIFPEMTLDFSNQIDLPSYAEFSEYYDELDWENYYDACDSNGTPVLDNAEDISKCLGYANIIQNSMLLQCEEVSNGIYRGDNSIIITDKQTLEFFENSKDWILLFQMGTVEHKDFELMWGDCGCIYYYIKKQDLAQRNFDNIWLILQCC